jgi:hypothetical protein
MTACWFCREPVTEPDPSQEMAAARAATAFASRPPPVVEQPAPASEVTTPIAPVPPDEPVAPVTPVVQAPVNVAPPPVEASPISLPRRRSRVRWGRVIVLGLIGGVLLTAGALAFESVWIRYLPDAPGTIALSRASFDNVGCTVAYPTGWKVQETKRRATFLSSETAKDRSTRGFRVNSTDIPFSRVDDQIEQLPDRLGSYAALETFSDSVDGKQATVHVFVADDLRFEQWWIDRGKRTLRVDLWSRPADEDAPVLNRRIVESITLL